MNYKKTENMISRGKLERVAKNVRFMYKLKKMGMR